MRDMSDEMLEFVIEKPFRPYRINMKDGRSYDIRYADYVYVGISRISLLAQRLDIPDVEGEWLHLPVSAIQSVEHLDAPVHS